MFILALKLGRTCQYVFKLTHTALDAAKFKHRFNVFLSFLNFIHSISMMHRVIYIQIDEFQTVSVLYLRFKVFLCLDVKLFTE